jgi:hypothetical protein
VPYRLLGARALASTTFATNGAFALDAAAIAFGAASVLGASGRGTESIEIPDDPTLIGVTLYWQASIGVPGRWTNVERTTLTGL